MKTIDKLPSIQPVVVVEAMAAVVVVAVAVAVAIAVLVLKGILIVGVVLEVIGGSRKTERPGVDVQRLE